MSAPWLIKKPTNPSAMDDEFEATGLDPKWTRISNAGLGTTLQATLDANAAFTTGNHLESLHRHRPSWIMRQSTAAFGGSYGLTEGLRQTISLPTDCFIYCRVSRNVRRSGNTDGDGEVAMRLIQNGTANYMMVIMDSFGTPRVEGLCSRSTTALGFANIGIVRDYTGEADPLTYFALSKVSNTYHGWFASASGNWVWANSFTHAVALDTVELYFANENNATPGNMIGGFDFFRVLSGKVVP